MKHLPSIETPFGQIYLKNNVGYVVLRKDLKNHLSVDSINAHYDAIENLTNGKSIPFICDVSKTEAFLMDRVSRKLILKRYHLHASSCAFLSKDIANTFFINLFCKVAPTKVPMRIFGSEKDALTWLYTFESSRSFSSTFSM